MCNSDWYVFNRLKAVLLGTIFYQYCVWYPESAKKLIKGAMYKQVESVMSKEEFETHFTPPYNPWEQRFCLAPDGDFFHPIRKGKATIVTNHIDHFTETGILMKNGQHVDADFIIAATGLTIQPNFPFSTIKVKSISQKLVQFHRQAQNIVRILRKLTH